MQWAIPDEMQKKMEYLESNYDLAMPFKNFSFFGNNSLYAQRQSLFRFRKFPGIYQMLCFIFTGKTYRHKATKTYLGGLLSAVLEAVLGEVLHHLPVPDDA